MGIFKTRAEGRACAQAEEAQTVAPGGGSAARVMLAGAGAAVRIAFFGIALCSSQGHVQETIGQTLQGGCQPSIGSRISEAPAALALLLLIRRRHVVFPVMWFSGCPFSTTLGEGRTEQGTRERVVLLAAPPSNHLALLQAQPRGMYFRLHYISSTTL